MERKYQEQFVLALLVILVLLATGTILFHGTEGWSYIDSFYFTGVTLTTLGYGDFVPVDAASKIVTVLFSFLGIGIVFYSITLIARITFEEEQERLDKLLNRRLKRKLEEEQSVREEAQKEAEKLVKNVEKEAEKIAEKMVERKK